MRACMPGPLFPAGRVLSGQISASVSGSAHVSLCLQHHGPRNGWVMETGIIGNCVENPVRDRFCVFYQRVPESVCRTNELQSMVDDMKHQNSVKDSDSPADAGEGEKDEGNDEIRD